jgi:hypothetical protein
MPPTVPVAKAGKGCADENHRERGVITWMCVCVCVYKQVCVDMEVFLLIALF